MRLPSITETNRRWWVLATMAGSLSMIMIDQTVVSVALPTMHRNLHLSPTGAQWVVNVYMLLLAMLVVVGGRLGDLFGPERMFRLGVGLFVGASAACGLAQGEVWMIAARGLQGVGAAMMVPATGAILTNTFAPRERGRAMGIYSGSSMVFLAIGPLVGGLLTQALSWRAVFFINLPIGLLTLAVAHLTIPHAKASGVPAGSFDWRGGAAVIVALGSLVLAMMQGQTWGWTSTGTLGLFGLATLAAIGLVWWELRIEEPLISPALLRKGNFAIDNVVLAAIQFGLVGVSVFGAIWVQTVLGFGPILAGLSLLPLTVTLLLAAPRAGRLYDRHGPRALLAGGTLLMGASLAWLGIVLDQLSYPWLVPGYVGIGLALGLAISPASTDALNAAAPQERGEASGLTQMTRQLGGSIGLAVLGAIIAGTHAGPGAAAARSATTTGTADGYLVAAGLMLVIAIRTALVVRREAASDARPVALAAPAAAAVEPTREMSVA
jgi:EmrB/QacA subfamily drug resistance transporter